MAALICGSFAFDTIMVFDDRFRNHILPEQVHILNVSFLVPEMRREFGGCAGNIAYNLRLLGGDPLPMGTVGHDFGPYAGWLEQARVDARHVKVLADTYTAQAFITTDLDDNQITAFHPGAMGRAHENRVQEATGVTIGMVSPDGRQGMVDHAAQFAEACIPFVFDPGQGLPMFDGPELKRFIDQASWVTVNDYESQLLQQRTGLSLAQIADRVDAVVVTKGAEGSFIHTPGGLLEVPAAPAATLADPTGCGDAYRAGLLYGLMHDLDWQTTGRLAALMGAVKIEHHGTQNHRPAREALAARFRDAWGYAIEL